jgi:hypothetical protein
MNQSIHKNPLVDAVKDAERPPAQQDLEATAEPDGQFPPPARVDDEGHEGATEEQVGDRTGPGVGYDQPEQEPAKP